MATLVFPKRISKSKIKMENSTSKQNTQKTNTNEEENRGNTQNSDENGNSHTKDQESTLNDVTFLMDMDGGGGLCFHDIHTSSAKK